MTSREISEWEAFDKLEPIGQYRTDIMIATLCSQVDNFMKSFGKRGHNRKPSQPKDFIPWMVKEEKQQKEDTFRSEEDVRAHILKMFGIPSDKGGS